MFRRSRFSVRPNVGTAGRAAATPQEAPPVNLEGSETPKDICESITAAAVTDNKSVVTPSEKPTAQEDGNDQTGEGTNSAAAAAVQRRKRFSVKPKVAPGRPSILARALKSPVKAISETPVEVPDSDLNKLTSSSQNATTAAPQGLQSPRRRRPSEESKQPKVQPKPSLITSDSSGLSVVDAAEDLAKQVHLSVDSGKQLESTSKSQIKQVTLRLLEKVPFSLPDKGATEISEKAKTLVSSKRSLSPSPAAFSLSRLLNDPSDLQRLAKAQKLRELLREELHKEKKIKKAKMRPKEWTLDPAKMTMRDLIHYLPVSNPMISSFEDPAPENETVAPHSPGRSESPERAQKPEVPRKIASPRGEEEEEEEEEAIEEEQEEALMVPQVKVAEDGSLIIDEESLTVEVQRAKGPNPAQDRDPIFERGSTTTYSSFRKGTYSKPWSSEETDMFFLAISMVGTDFTMVCQLFPHRARSEIKNKFKKEERLNSWRIDKAFRERRKLDIEYFSKLLEKILEVQKSRKKLKSLTEKNSRKENKRKAKGKKAARKLSNVEEEEESEISDMEEEEGEKENEELCNEGGSPVAKPEKKCKRKNRQDASTKEPDDKKNKRDEKSNAQDDAHIPKDAESALPKDHANSNKSKKTEDLNVSKDKAINPAKLSRDRAPKQLPHSGPKSGKKPPPPSTENKDTMSDKGEEWVNDGATEEQVEKDASPVRQGNKRKSPRDDDSSEEEDASIQPLKPTRYGRMPKPTKPLTYPPKNDTHSSASETTSASPVGSTASAAGHKPKCTAKRKRLSKPQSVQESKKSKLVTLRASQSEYSDDEENEKQWEVEEGLHPQSGSSRDSIAAAFVPASLRSPHPLIAEVEETMEELDILVNMPDELGISQDALCPDVTCKLAQNETGPAEPCEHQLDLLVDVIDCVSSECTVSEDESYNEAAHTLLTIGSLAHNSQFSQNQTATQDQTTGTSVSLDETSQNPEEDVATKLPSQEEKSDTSRMSETSAQGVKEQSETTATVELQNSKTDYGNMPVTVSSNQRPVTSPQSQSCPEKSEKISSQTRRGRLSKVKPKPNLGQASRSVQPKSQPETSTEKTAMEAPTVSANLSQTSEILSAAKETSPKADCSQKRSNEISFIEVKLPEEAFGTQERAVDQLTSGAATLDQSPCLFDTGSEQSLEQATRESTDEILMSEVGTTKSSCSYLVRADTAVTELQRTKTDTAPVQQNRNHPVSSVKSVKDEPVSQKEESGDASTHQTWKSGFQKVRPKPNLLKISRTAHSKSQTTEDTEKNSNLTPNPCSMSHENPIVPVEAAEKHTDVVVVGQVRSDQSASEDRFIQEVSRHTSPTSDSTEGIQMSHVGAIGPGSNTYSAPVQESSDHCAPRIIPASQKEGSDLTSTRPTVKSRFPKVKPKPNIALTSRAMRSKPTTAKDTIEENPTRNPEIQKKIKYIEAEPPSITSSYEKPSQNTGPFLDLIPPFDVSPTHTTTEKLSTAKDKEIDVGVVGQVESSTEPSGQSTSENPNFSKAQFEPSREQATRDTSPPSESTEEELMSHVGTIERNYSNLLTSDSEIPEKVRPRSNIDAVPIQESISLVKELPVSQKEDSEVVSTCQTGKGKKINPKPNLPQTSIAMPSKRQTTTHPVTHMQLVDEPSSPTSRPVSSDNVLAETEAQPTHSITSPEISSQIKSTGTASLLPPLLELCSTHKPTEEKTDIQSSHISSSEGSENKVPQRRRRFSKIKPNLGSSTRNKTANDCSKPSEVFHIDTSSNVTSERQPTNSNDTQMQLQPTEKDSKHVTSLEHSLHTELIRSTKLGSAESEMSVDGQNDKGTTSDGVVLATSVVSENQLVLTESVIENKSSEKPTFEGESTRDMVAAGLASQWDCKQNTPVRVPETNTQSTNDPTAILIVQSSEEGSSESKMKYANTLCIFDPKESTQQLRLEDAPEVQIQDALQQSSDTTVEANPTAAQSAQDKKLEPTNSSKSSRKALQTRRGRLVKPKPNLGPSSRPKQIQNITQSEAESVTGPEFVSVSISDKPVSEGQADIQKPVEGAIEQSGCLTQVIEQRNQHDSPPDVAASSLGCLTQVADNYTQDESTSSTDRNQGQPNLTIFSDMLLEHVPSEPDEPFFVLSLTEIPVCSMAEPVDSTSEPLPCLPVAHSSVQRESVPGEGLAPAEDGPLSVVAMPVSTEETCETGLIHGAISENPVDPPESTTIQPSILPETVENNEETERPPTKQRLRSTQTANQQAKPKIPRKKQATKALAAMETESTPTQISELPGPSVEPKSLDEVLSQSKKASGDRVDIKKGIVMDGEDPADRNIGAQTTQTRRTSSCRKPKCSNSSTETNSTALLSSSKGRKVITPHPVGKRSTPAPVASTSYDVAPKRNRRQQSEDTHLMPSTTSPTAEVDMEQTSEHSQMFSNPTYGTSPCTAERSDSLENICVHEEEPTVSQYFLSDIFTEVEEE